MKPMPACLQVACAGTSTHTHTHTANAQHCHTERDTRRRVFSSSLPLAAAPTLMETIRPQAFFCFQPGSSHVNDSLQPRRLSCSGQRWKIRFLRRLCACKPIALYCQPLKKIWATQMIPRRLKRLTEASQMCWCATS